MTITADASFDGAAFREIFDGQLAVAPDSGTEYATTKIPGGGAYTIDSAGAGPRVLQLPIGATDAQLASLRSKADNAVRGSLVYHAGTVAARLMKVTQVRDAAIVDAHRATLELIMG